MASICTKVRSKFVLNDNAVPPNDTNRISYFENIQAIWYNNLPVNVLINIFKYFNEVELRTCIIPVCQNWKYAAQNPVLWKSLVIRGTHIPLHFICKQLRMFPKLEFVFIDNIVDSTTVIRQICRCLPEIKHLAIRYCSPVPETAVRFIISSCPLLESLDLCGSEIRGDIVYRSLGGLNNLKKLNLSGNPYLTVKSLISIVLNCPTLKDLRISKFSNKRESFKNEDALMILSNLTDKLTSLSFDCTALSSMTIQQIFYCKDLERLGLYGATNLTGAQFGKIWQNLPKLKQMKIRNAHQIGDLHINDVFTNGKPIMENLIYLDFGGCFRISDESIGIIADCCNKLQYLGLKNCKSITDFTPAVKRNPKLRTLNIAFLIHLNTETLTLSPLPSSLKKVFIDESRLLDGWLVRFRNVNKNTKILVCHSEYNKSISEINVFNT